MDIKDIENVHFKFCKYILGLPRKSVNDVSLGELGRTYISSFALYNKIKYWFKILKHDQNRFTSICYNHMLDLDRKNIYCWVTEVKNLLFSFGYGNVWLKQSVDDEPAFLASFWQRVLDINRQMWKTKITMMPKLSLYGEYKSDNCFEFYITHVPSKHHRVQLTRFRCCSFSLQIHTGRINNTPRESRICTFCNLNKIEDEFHFLMICPLYNELRSLYLPRKLCAYPSKENFIKLLNSKEKLVLHKLCLFLKNAKQLHSEIESYHVHGI